jgi:(p)ppGpp synthase/HD superfamily hydrolase
MPSPVIEAAAADSQLIRDALEMADRAHAGQTRNGSGGMAFIHHPVTVAELLAQHGFREETVAAALLHDVVEDSDTSLEAISSRFGEPVTELVGTLTEDEAIQPYRLRKDMHRQRVERTGGDAVPIYAADKLSNVRVLRRTYDQEGESAGEEFSVSLDEKMEIWNDDLEMLRREAADLPFVEDFAAELARLRQARAAGSMARPPG